MRARSTLVLALAAALTGCSGLGREINQALPEFLRSEPGAKEMEILRKVAETRRWTEEDLAAQARMLEEARALRAEEEWDDAAGRLEMLLEDYPGSRFDAEARFLLGDSWYRADEWDKAFNAWRELTLLHPVSEFNTAVIDDLYIMGREFLAGNRNTFFGIFSRRGMGVRILNHLIETFPSTARAADAQWLIAKHHLDEEEWREAEGAFQFLVDHFESSEWYQPALYYLAFSQYRQVKGAAYDPETMRKAREGFERYLSRAPEGAWRAEANDAKARLLELEAEHVLGVGEWYIHMDKPYSARYYLMSVITRFPETEAARRAQTLLPETPSPETGTEPQPETPGAAESR